MTADYEAACYFVGPLPTNCYVLKKKDRAECVIIDPGPGAAGIIDEIMKNEWVPEAILVTHGHSDHVDGLEALQEALLEKTGKKVPSYAAESEKEVFANPSENVSEMITGKTKRYFIENFLTDDEEKEFAGMKVKVLYTPGHTRGGCSYYFLEAGVVFCGDTVFAGSVGRTDFPGGSMSALVRSATEKILSLPEDTDILPGHGEPTTVGREQEENPYFCY